MPTKYSLLSPEQKRARIEEVKDYIARNKEKVRARRKKFYQENRDRLKAETRKNSLANPEKTAEYQKAYKEKHKTALSEYFAAHYQKNKKRITERHRLREAARKKEDPNYRLGRQIRCRISAAIREQYGSKAFKTLELIGCTVEELRAHIEKQWTAGMSWSNWTTNGWHIDHLRPVTAFDLTDPAQQKLCFHWSNLGPKWWLDNIRKGNKITTRQTLAAAPAPTPP